MADWNAIRAEYIGGGISTRKLAAKYGVSYPTLKDRSVNEGWVKLREQAKSEAIALSSQKTAEAASDCAATASRIRAMLLNQIEKEIKKIQEIEEGIGTETSDAVIDNIYAKDKNGKIIGRVPEKTTERRVTRNLKQLTSAYKDLTGDMNLNGNTEQVRIVIDV